MVGSSLSVAAYHAIVIMLIVMLLAAGRLQGRAARERRGGHGS